MYYFNQNLIAVEDQKPITASCTPYLSEVRRIENQGHEYTSESASDGNRSNPCNDEEAYSLEVDSLEGTVAKTNSDSGSCDAHRRRHRQFVLGEDKDGHSSTHLHGAATARTVVCDLVAHNYI